MSPVLGHAIVILILAVIVYFCGRNVIRDIRGQLSGRGSCGGCSGNCAKCGGSCKAHTPAGRKGA